MTEKWHGGKGSRYRKVDQTTYNDAWDRVFGPITVEWKGKPGYGDICGAVGYANNLSQKTGKKVILEWTSFNGFLERLDPIHEHPDSEDTNYRLDKIFDMMATENVKLKIRYNENCSDEINKIKIDSYLKKILKMITSHSVYKSIGLVSNWRYKTSRCRNACC